MDSKKFPFDTHLLCVDKNVFDVSDEILFRGCINYENWYDFYDQELCMNNFMYFRNRDFSDSIIFLQKINL